MCLCGLLASISAFTACSAPPEMQKAFRDGVSLMERDFEEAKPFITPAHIELCRKAFEKENANPLLFVRYKVTSAFLPSKTLTCLARPLYIPQRQANDPARLISYGAEISAIDGVILKTTPNIFSCQFKVENGTVSLVSAQIVSVVNKNTFCQFPGDPAQISN